MRKFISFMIVILLLLLSACNNKEEQSKDLIDDVKKDELILAIGGEPESGFDPTTGWGRYGSPLFQSTLLKYDEDLNIQYDLAESYEVSDDGLVWTITIRDDVVFSDGESLTTDDIVFTYETAKQSGSIIDLSNLNKIEKVDEYTVQFVLKEPESTFIYLLTTLGIVPEHAYDDIYSGNPIGSGPYQFVQWDKGQQLIVEENPHYYGEKPYFKKLTFLFLSQDAAFAAAKAGQVDVVSVPPSFAKENIEGMRLVELESVDNRGIMLPYVEEGRQTENGYPIGNDVTADIAIRKALNIAIDREALVEGILEGFGAPAFTVSDKLPWWNPETVFQDGDMEVAKTILEDAGWKENEQGIREKDGLTAEFSLIYPAGDQVRQSLAIAYADMMAPLGISIHTEGKSWNDIEREMYSTPVMMGWGSHDPLELYNLYSSQTRGIDYYNANYYSNPIVDEYMEKAMRTTSLEKANEYWKKAQWDGETGFSAKGDAPWVWLVNVHHLYFINENLEIGEQKVQPHGHGWPITDFVANWSWNEVEEE